MYITNNFIDIYLDIVENGLVVLWKHVLHHIQPTVVPSKQILEARIKPLEGFILEAKQKLKPFLEDLQNACATNNFVVHLAKIVMELFEK